MLFSPTVRRIGSDGFIRASKVILKCSSILISKGKFENRRFSLLQPGRAGINMRHT